MSKTSLVLIGLSVLVFTLSYSKKEERPYRKIVSTVTYANSQGAPHQVLKIISNSQVSVEIYNVSSQIPTLVSRFENLGALDGHFVLGGSGTQLALFDIDHDLSPEILVPTFDLNLNARLNIIKYNKGTDSFELFEETENPGFL